MFLCMCRAIKHHHLNVSLSNDNPLYHNAVTTELASWQLTGFSEWYWIQTQIRLSSKQFGTKSVTVFQSLWKSVSFPVALLSNKNNLAGSRFCEISTRVSEVQMQSVTMTSYGRHSVSRNHRRLDCLFNGLFRQSWTACSDEGITKTHIRPLTLD